MIRTLELKFEFLDLCDISADAPGSDYLVVSVIQGILGSNVVFDVIIVIDRQLLFDVE